MPRRDDDTAFGSDSFLDIVANVVGILIILIVIVGVRVSRLPPKPRRSVAAVAAAATRPPLPPPASQPAPAPQPPPLKEPPPAADESPARVESAAAPPGVAWPGDDPFQTRSSAAPPIDPPPQTIVVERPLPPLPPPEAPASLTEAAARLEQSLTELVAQRAELQRRVEEQEGQLAQARSRLQAAQSQRRAAERAAAEGAAAQRVAAERVAADLAAAERAAAARAAAERSELAAGERELEATLAQLQALRRKIAETAAAEPEATVIQHRVSPIGRVVEGDELHFHLSQGRVAPVPVAELARRLTSQIERQKAMLAKLQAHEGIIEPVDGFRMKYVIEKKSLSLSEELKYGQQVVRLAVTQWTLIPEPGFPAETAEQAMQRGSQFYQALLAAGPTATLTFWVYPDSFELCQRLKEFAHRHGYDVAARPLPFGVFITGSPDGSKSIAQ